MFAFVSKEGWKILKFLIQFPRPFIVNVNLTDMVFFYCFCDEHIFFKRVFGSGSFVFNCQYFKLGLFEYRQNCCQIRYIMSFIADKICVEKVPETTERQIVKTENYLKSIKNETFFIFCSKETNIYLRLDNHDFKETSTFRKFGNDLILVQCIKF